MKVLIIDNNIDPTWWGSPDLRKYAALLPGATFEARRGPQHDLPVSPRGYDRIILSGSKTSAMESAPWISRLHDFIREAIDAGKPMLGVCYGHQAIARALGGIETVRTGSQAEFGWAEIELLGESPLTEGLPKKFHSFAAHFEEVAQLPRGMKHLARSEGCEIQACQLEGKPVFGIQFHPEKNIFDADRVFAERKAKGEPKKLLNPGKSQKYYDPKVGELVFGNFLRLAT